MLVKYTDSFDLTRGTGSNRTVGTVHRGSCEYWETSNSNLCGIFKKIWLRISVH